MKDSIQTAAFETKPGTDRPGNAVSSRTGGRRMSLRTKGTLVTIILLIISFAVATYASVLSARSSLTNTLKDNLAEQAKVESGNIRSFLIWTRSFAIDLAAATETNNFSGRVISDTVENFLAHNEQIYGSAIAYEPYEFRRDLYYWAPYYSRSNTGEINFTQLGNPEYNYFGWDWYILPKNQNAPVLSPPYYDAGGGEIWMVTWSVPFYDSLGQFRGVATADIAFSKTQELIQQIGVGQAGYAFMIDSNGVILGIGDKSGKLYDVMEDSALLPDTDENSAQWNALIREMMTGNASGFKEVIDPQGNPVFVAYEPVGMNTDWTLGLAYSQAELFAPVNSLQNTLITISLVVLLIFSFISLFIMGFMIRPIQLLASYANEFSQTWVSSSPKSMTLKPIRIKSGDELEDLGNAFNRMTSELSDTLETMESKVTERTADLDNARKKNERRAQQFEAVAQVARAITSTQTPGDFLPRVTELISQQFGFYHVGIFLVDEENKYAVLTAANSEGGKRMIERGHKLKVGLEGIVGNAVASGYARIALDTGRDLVYFDNPELSDTHSEIALPLKIGSHVMGVLDVQSTEPDAFNNEDIASLSILADQVSIAIQNTRQYESTLRSLEQTQLQYRQYVQDEWRRLKKEDELIGFRHTAGSSQPLHQPIHLGEAAKAAEQGRIYQRDGTQVSDTAELAVPVRVRGEVIGVLSISMPGKRKWSDDELDIAEAVSERLALAMENARLFQSTNKRAARERVMAEIASKISGTIRIESLLETTAQELSRALDSSEVLIQLQAVNPDGGQA